MDELRRLTMTKELYLGVHRDANWLLRFLNKLGLKLYWTHAFLLYDDEVIEAGPFGVECSCWRPDLRPEYALLRLKDESWGERESWFTYMLMWSFARGQIGKRYKFEALPIIARRIIRKTFGDYVKRKTGVRLIGSGQVCTSLCDDVFRHCFFDLVPDEDSAFVLPDEFYESPLLEIVEEGGWTWATLNFVQGPAYRLRNWIANKLGR
jgi:hypothetical protein